MKSSAVAAFLVLPILGAVACGSSSSTGKQAASATPVSLGEEKKPAAVVLSDMRSAFLSSSSVRVQGNEDTGDGDLSDFEGQVGPRSGHIEVQLTSGVADLITVNGLDYLKAPITYLKSVDSSFPAQLDERWASRPSDPSSSVTLSGFLSGLDLPGTAKLKPTVTTDTVGGRPAVVLTYTDGQVLYVADTGKPVLLGHTAGPEEQTLDSYDEPLNVTAPTGAVSLGSS